MPDWQRKSVRELTSVLRRGTAPTYVTHSPVRAIGQRCVRDKGFDPSAARPHDEGVRGLQPANGDVLLNSTGTGTIGRSCIFDGPGEFIVDGHVTLLRPAENADGRFLNEILRSPRSQRKLETDCYTGSTNQVELSRTQLARMELQVPALAEQRRIAGILDTIDETIGAAERVMAKLNEVERGVRSDLLRRMSASRRERPAVERRQVREFARVTRGASPRPIDNPVWFDDKGPGWVRISDVTASDGLLVQTKDHLSPAGAARSRRVRPGDVIMSIAATIGKAIVLGMDACIHDGFVHIDHDSSVSAEFLVFLLEQHADDFVRSGQTGTQSNINSTIVGAMSVPVPDRAEQDRVVATISAMRSKRRAEESRLLKLTETRAGLADDLLSGRVQVPA